MRGYAQKSQSIVRHLTQNGNGVSVAKPDCNHRVTCEEPSAARNLAPLLSQTGRVTHPFRADRVTRRNTGAPSFPLQREGGPTAPCPGPHLPL